ncbi:electron transporter, putative [Ricinus communis]|uniref:Electron transporter, putative n=1 Tax=Ricinus communis TaxID=3988 RepID=B9ST47_RICCO|nr:electron transporter, putative [Ricinus communis]|eukprot:XP_002529166.1 uncharacterized protein At3g28850 [Ricinus communis]
MGCSASRPDTLHARNNNHPEETNLPYASPSLSNSGLSASSFLFSQCYSSSSSSSSSSLPVRRALSLQTPLVHHPPSKKGDSHHLVSLTSTTYGSLLLINEPPIKSSQPQSPPKFTKTTHRTPIPADPGVSFSPDSVINTWELMDGLDDDLDFQNPKKPPLSDHQVNSKSSSFQHLGFDDSVKKVEDSVKSEEESIVVEKSFSSLSKPLWKHLSEESLLSNMDPNVVSSYRRALSSRQLGYTKESKCTARSVGSSPMNYSSAHKNGFFLHNTRDDKIVLYFTSLRGIRKTYEDCCAVRMIFRGFRVPVDEKDISMDSSYRKELQSMLKGKAMCLPQVFIRGEHIGGVEEIRQLNEAGELAKLLEGFPVRDPRLVCENCGDARFVPCPNCNGSRKVFDVEQEKLRRCLDCNENGLIRCPGCCSKYY